MAPRAPAIRRPSTATHQRQPMPDHRDPPHIEPPLLLDELRSIQDLLGRGVPADVPIPVLREVVDPGASSLLDLTRIFHDAADEQQPSEPASRPSGAAAPGATETEAADRAGSNLLRLQLIDEIVEGVLPVIEASLKARLQELDDEALRGLL